MQKIKDRFFSSLMLLSVLITVLILVVILGFVTIKGANKINYNFITNQVHDISYYVNFKKDQTYNFEYKIINENDNKEVMITKIDNDNYVINNEDKEIELKQGMIINNIDKVPFRDMSDEEIHQQINQLKNPKENIYTKIIIPQSGILPLILSTLLSVIIALFLAVPIGLFAAIYLIEYKVNPKLSNLIHFCIDSLASIPSIVFGLFGYIFFVITLNLKISLLSGILTVVIMLLPTIIKTIEEALLTVPNDIREASYGLGACKYQTIFKIVIPTAFPGIILAIILAIGRIIGESAIFIFTAGTAAIMPTLLGQSSTMTVYAYTVVREYNDLETACAIGLVIIIIIFILNLLMKKISKKYIY